ncbi:MAG: hypothetical protein HYV02_05900 [Deltaproteobacteria bacterium]|nr:hypothetical protein [Deltaproteobacteria bacterium]
MNPFDWQQLFALVISGMAGWYLLRAFRREWRESLHGGCGGCILRRGCRAKKR